MPIKYISPTSTISTFDVDCRVMDDKCSDYSTIEPPWMIVGNVFASVSYTGNTSWKHVIQDLIKKGQTKFLVLAGRHGNLEGNLVGDDGLNKKRDPNDPKDTAIDPKLDEDTAKDLRKPGITIEVKDVDDASYRTLPGMQSLIKDGLNRDFVVILGWCFSFHGMKSTIKISSPDMVKAEANFYAKINHTFDADWKFIESYPQLPAAQKAQSEAIKLT